MDHEVTETVDATEVEARLALAFIGAGRAGSALATALHDAGHRIVAVHSRTPAHAAHLAASTGAEVVPTALAAMCAADLTFATVPDGEIVRVAATVAATGGALRARALVHCSATHGPDVLAALRLTCAEVGSFHPLQALAGARSAPLLRGSSFAVEAEEPLRSTLLGLVADLGGHAIDVPADGRALYHAAAVLAGNAPLALLARATSLLEEAGVARADAHRALVALLAGAVSNAREGGPAGALTGPVVRGDATTVARHLDVLTADPNTRELYRRLSLEALSLAGPAGREAVADTLAAAAPRTTRSSSKVVAHPRVA
ncbi:MAG: DUF2520 domain-containing protein [Candidatus Aeolococcus gillhamiae]|uniref:DUF2520 domain-containing protein n=1 Tax=Candidatus Aeolococcus gillhamiae TaxID=3127015 RepID=A0A2W5YZA3_9BACT|nr:MAG: DUF2520 domain-containing protein [Candidatus Dormibacter sp. RRmetagenome_bin12]